LEKIEAVNDFDPKSLEDEKSKQFAAPSGSLLIIEPKLKKSEVEYPSLDLEKLEDVKRELKFDLAEPELEVEPPKKPKIQQKEPTVADELQTDEYKSKLESPKNSQITESLNLVKTNEDISTIKGEENENKSQENPNLSVEKIPTEALQVTFNEIDITPENISKEDSLIANVNLKTSTACPNEDSERSEILASSKDTICQEAPSALDLKEDGKIKDPDSNLEE
jgi:hypothetical protein